MDQIYIEVGTLIICMALSAFFSGSESALFSLTKSDLHRFSHSHLKREKAIYTFMKDPQKILITLLAGNLFVNLVVSMLSTSLMLQVWPRWGDVISIAILTPLIIIFCEISPKIIAINSYENASKKVLPALRFFHIVLTPVRALLLLFTSMMIKIFNLKLTHKAITRDELKLAVKLGEEKGVIGKDEGAFIQNVLRFAKKDAANIMFPRSSAVFIPYGSSIRDAMKTFIESGVIRIPVYQNDIDHVIGMVDSRELIPYHLGFKKARNINRFIQEIKFFPASRELHDLLNDFLAGGIQIAIVVDEYGGTAGVVTLNKLLSELMGRDMTKWEDYARHAIRRIDDNISVISGELQIDDFNAAFAEDLKSQNADTIGGYIIEKLAYIPKRGDVLRVGAYIFRIRHIRKNKIETVEVIRPSEGGDLLS
ncbi:MAG TPA: hemolysin family protein [Spirochaetota bacterium]|nr:hemolysin family protein [Spirochaetota bacterium]HPV43318.1 hemolysin family protein [Spirochaetota bacterium]